MQEEENRPSSMQLELQFIADVKKRFSESNQLERYHLFCCALYDFKCRNISSTDVTELANTIFQGHKDLHQNFLNFLPEELREIYSKKFEDIKQNRGQRIQALILNFFFKVSYRLIPESHESFLSNVRHWKEKPAEVYEKIHELFEIQADLIHEFEKEFMREACDLTDIKQEESIMNHRAHKFNTLLFKTILTEEHVERLLKEGREDAADEEFNQAEKKFILEICSKFDSGILESLRNRPREVLPLILEVLKKEKEKLNQISMASDEVWDKIHRNEGEEGKE